MDNDILRFALAILATFRIARLLPDDDGPLYIFQRMRLFAEKKVEKEHEKGIALGAWSSIYDGITCPYCLGLYVAILGVVLLIYPTFYGDVLLLVFALAGGQSLLQKWTEK